MAKEIHVSPDGPRAAIPPRPGTTAPRTIIEPSLGELFRQLAQDSSVLIKQEIALAKTELSESASRAASSATKLAVSLGIAMVGGLVLTAFLVLLLGELLDSYWVSALIVGALFAVVGGALAMSALNELKKIDYAPDATIQTLKQDRAWAQSEMQQVKRDLTT